MRPIRFQTVWPILLAILALTLGNVAQGPPAATPSELIRRAVENEVKSNNQGPKYMCRERKETPSGSQIKLMVETRDAMVGMVVANNDQPLTQEQRRDEYGRIERFVNEPAELERKRRQEKEAAERVNLILKAFYTNTTERKPAGPAWASPENSWCDSSSALIPTTIRPHMWSRFLWGCRGWF
jgi:hypothetical protein